MSVEEEQGCGQKDEGRDKFPTKSGSTKFPSSGGDMKNAVISPQIQMRCKSSYMF